MGESELVTRNARVVTELVESFLVLERECWRCPAARKRLEGAAFRGLGRPHAVAEFFAAVEETCAAHPNVRFFWKDAHCALLGSSLSMVRDAGVGSLDALLGMQDTDAAMPWSRQGAKYQADDRRVMELGAPQLDILERQDETGGAVRWLRTSKVPVKQSGRVVGTIGGFEIISAEAARALVARSARG